MNSINQPQPGMQLLRRRGPPPLFHRGGAPRLRRRRRQGPARGAYLLRRASRHRLPHFRSLGVDGDSDRPVRARRRVREPEEAPQGIYRAVPVPPELLDALDLVHGIREAQRRGQAKALLWPWSRMTAFRRVQEVIAAAGIPDGPHACPKGLRHGFGMQAVVSRVSLKLTSSHQPPRSPTQERCKPNRRQ